MHWTWLKSGNKNGKRTFNLRTGVVCVNEKDPKIKRRIPEGNVQNIINIYFYLFAMIF